MGLCELGINVRIFFLERQRYGQFIYLNAVRKIETAFNKNECNLVHVQFGGIQALQAVRAVGRRTIITFHGTDLHGGNPLNLPDKVSCWLGRYASRWAARRAGWNIIVAEHLGQHLVGVTERIDVIPTGVDYNIFYPRSISESKRLLSLDDSTHYILFCDANRNPVKRADLARSVVQLVQTGRPNTKFLELNRVPHRDVPLYLNASDCVLITSEKEGSPNIVKEAIACNVPVVSVAVGDIPERLNGIENCFVTSTRPSDLAQAVDNILEKNERANGREMKRAEIENMAVCQKVMLIYENVLKEIS